MTWVNQLFSYMDKSKDGKLQINELIVANSPSLGINYQECNEECNEVVCTETCVPAVMDTTKARDVGKKTTRVFLAMLLHSVPNALNDNVIDLNELKANAAKTRDIKLFTDEDPTVPTTLGATLLAQADAILENY